MSGAQTPRRPGLALLSAAVLAGCASTPAPAPLPPPASAPAPQPAPPPPDPRPAVERQLQQRAETAEAQGRLADALWAREALLLLRPGDAAAAAHTARLRSLRDQRIAEAMTRGRDWQRRGDADRAQRSFLAALALDPAHAGAADALRQLERERQERQQPGRFARDPMASANPSAARPGPESVRTPGDSNLAEHAAMLASQGEIDAAISLLARPGDGPRADPALRRQLAELHLRRAQALPPQRRADARAALREALRLEPGMDAARQLLQQLGTR